VLKQNLILELREDKNFAWKLKSRFFKKQVLSCIEISKEFFEIKNRNLYIIIEGEEVYIKTFFIPKCSKEAIRRIICQELNMFFNNAENLTYSYKIISKTKDVLEILAFYLNSEKLAKLKGYDVNRNKLKVINIVQFYVFNYYYKNIKEKVYLLIFTYNDNLYILGCNNKNVISNTLIKNYKGVYNDETILSLIKKHYSSINNHKTQKIYLANFSDDILLERLGTYYEVYNLGVFSNEQLCISIMGDRNCRWKN
jgi:hypothetical protein